MGITIEQIAKKAKVSKTAISFILNNKPGVSMATRKRVLKVMKDMGYRPNALARAFASNRSWMICLVVPEYERVFGDPYFGSALSAVHSECKKKGYRVVIESASKEFIEEKQFNDLYLTRQVEGMLIVRALLNDKYLLELKEKGCPVMLINNRMDDELDYVTSDNFKCGYDAIGYLATLGHKNIAVITGDNRDSSSIDRYEGCLKAMKDFGLKINNDLVVSGGYRYDITRSAILPLLQKIDNFTAIFCLNDTMAVSAIDALREIGKRVPEDISIVGVDNYSGYNQYNLTTFTQDVYSVSRRATQLFLDKINNDEKLLINETIPMPLVPGKTTRRIG